MDPRVHPPRLPLRPFPPEYPPILPLLPADAGCRRRRREDLTGQGDREVEEDRDERYGFEMEVWKLQGKKNRRLVRARVRVGAPLQAVWATLTDYEGLVGFIPGLSKCRLLRQDKAFAHLYQVGEQDLALGFKFNAKGTIDSYEGRDGAAPRVRGAPPGDRLQHGRRRFQGLPGQMVCPGG